MTITDEERAEVFERYNRTVAEAYDALVQEGGLSSDMPVGRVRWVQIDQVRANDYNPNAVAHHEMKLLHTSIKEDGYTMPVVTIEDDEHPGRYIIVDGFHRWTTMKKYEDIAAATGGYLPIVVIDKPVADRIASTVRHNRARGKHSVSGMGNLVFEMLKEGESDEAICDKLGLETEELARLKHITGYSKLYANERYSKVTMLDTQIRHKARYKAEHPEEEVPAW